MPLPRSATGISSDDPRVTLFDFQYRGIPGEKNNFGDCFVIICDILVKGGGYFIISKKNWYGYNYLAALVMGLIGVIFVINPSQRNATGVIKLKNIPLLTPLIFSTTVQIHHTEVLLGSPPAIPVTD